MIIIRNKKEKSLAEKGARIIEEEIRSMLAKKEKKRIIMALAGGRSVCSIYRELLQKNIPWKKIHFFLADERNVPINSDESNYKLINDCFFGKLIRKKLVSKKQIHQINTLIFPQNAVKEYELALRKQGNAFDIVILSAGEDGHVASIFPGKKYPSKKGFFFLRNSPKHPKERFTAAPLLIQGAKTGILLFYGENKKDALDCFLSKKNKKSMPKDALKKIKKLIILTDN